MKNKVLTLLLSLALSFGLWLYVVTVISPESEATYYNIPVELVGTDYLDAHDLIIVSDTKNLKMNLTLKGNRSDLAKITSSNITIIADSSFITQPGEHRLKCTVSFQSGSAEVQSQSPEYISVTVAQQATKTIEVRPIYTGVVPSGYEAATDSVVLDHKTVTVKGPKDVVDRIGYAGINVDLSGKTTMVDGIYPLTLYGVDSQPILDDQYISVNVTEVRAIIQIHQIRKVPVKFHLDFTGSGLQESMVTIYPLVDEVTLIGTKEALAKVEDEFVFIIEMNKYHGATTETFTPVLPDGVSCEEEIMVHIQMPEMTTRWLSVHNFRLENVEESLTVEVNGTVKIGIWGPEDILVQLSAQNVVGIVDCSDVNADSERANVIFLISGYEYLCVKEASPSVPIVVQPRDEG